MEVFKLFGSILIDNDAANKSLQKTDEQAQKSGGTMTNTFKKVGTALVAAFSVQKIIEFGKAAVESAASVKASNAQFEQTFGDLANKSNDIMKNVSKNSGILQTRLQDTGTKIYAFAKTSGMESTDALGLMERALTATADSAAYYDRSLETTAETLQSFLKGNYANDAALGLSATETTRNAAANKLYGKSFNKLSESQKQLTLLQMVEDANKLSGAMGQAARESDGFENVMGNLKESWKQFLAVVGSPILNLVIPVLQGISSAISFVTSNIGGLGTGWGSIFSIIKSYWDIYGNPIFQSLLVIASTLYDSWLSIFPILQATFITAFDLMCVAWDTIGKPLFDGIEFIIRQLSSVFSVVFPVISSFVSDAFVLINLLARQIIMPCFEAMGGFLNDFVMPVFRTVFSFIASYVASTFSRIDDLWKNVLKPIFDGIINFVGGVFKGDWESALDGLLSIATGVWNGIKKAITAPMDSAKQFVKGIIDAIKGFFNFDIKWPKIPLPHFGIKPKDWGIGDLLKGEIPSLGIDWYAKAMDNGMIMNSPTIFGAANGKLLGGGEAGSETVVGTQSLMDMISAASQSNNNELLNVLNQIKNYLADEDRWYRVILRALSDGSIAIILDNREIGRLMKKYA